MTAFRRPALRLARRGERLGKKRAYLLILCSAVFFTGLFLGADALFARLEADGRQYSAEITAPAGSVAVPLRGSATLELGVANSGSMVWDSNATTAPVRLGWHILSEQGGMIRFDNPRTPLPGVLRPGESGRVSVIIAPSECGIPTGRYLFEFDLVQEDVAWFADKGSAACRVPVEVLP